MPVQLVQGDLFDSKAQTLVNTVNCAGVMGKGIAKEFKRRFPEMFADYVQRCDASQVRLGEPYIYPYLIPPNILNFPTKDHWRSDSRLDDIVVGLEHLLANYEVWGITSLAVPALGCGNGQLEWAIVAPVLDSYLSRLAIPVELYPPANVPIWQTTPSFLECSTEAEAENGPTEANADHLVHGWLAIAQIVARVNAERYHWPVTRRTVRSILHLATKIGIPTGLQFESTSSGFHCSGMSAYIKRMLNNGLLQEVSEDHYLTFQPGVAYEIVASRYLVDLRCWESKIDSIVDLVVRLDPRELELTVILTNVAQDATHAAGSVPTEQDILLAVQQQESPGVDLPANEVAQMIRELAILGWLNVRYSSDLPLPADYSLFILQLA